MRTSGRIPALLGAVVLLSASPLVQNPPGGAIVPHATTIVSADAPHDPFAESFLAVDPEHAARMIATALTVHGKELDSALYQSIDSGAHWKRVDTGRYFDTADPIVYFGPSGRAFFESEASGGVNLMTSDDLQAWKPFHYTRIGRFFDRPYIGFDTQGPFKGRMYLAAAVEMYDSSGTPQETIAISSSRDNGASFSAPLLYKAGVEQPGGNFMIPADVLVTPDGSVIVPYQYAVFPGKHIPKGPHKASYEVLISKDGGLSFAARRAAQAVMLCCQSYRATSVSAGVRGTVDLSQRRYRGRVYLSWANYTGAGTDIDVVHSSDDGRTWSKPVRVNDNRVPSDHANPAVAVNDHGVLAVVWNDRRNFHGNACYRLYGSASLDGGDTFLPNVPLSDAATCPNAAGNWKPVLLMEQNQPGTPNEKWLNVLTVATRWPNGGDTQGLQARPGGEFGAAWIDGASGVMQLAYTRFAVQGSAPAALPQPQETPAAAGAKPLNATLDLNVVSGIFDPSRGIFSVRLQLKNVSAAPVRGPFAIVLKRTISNLPHLHATNSDNGVRGNGSEWIVGSGASLQPGQSSAIRTATWAFDGYPKAPVYPVFIFEVKHEPT